MIYSFRDSPGFKWVFRRIWPGAVPSRRHPHSSFAMRPVPGEKPAYASAEGIQQLETDRFYSRVQPPPPININQHPECAEAINPGTGTPWFRPDLIRKRCCCGRRQIRKVSGTAGRQADTPILRATSEREASGTVKQYRKYADLAGNAAAVLGWEQSSRAYFQLQSGS